MKNDFCLIEGFSSSSIAEIQRMFNLIFNELMSSDYFRLCPTDESEFKIFAVYNSSAPKQCTDNEFYVRLSDDQKYYLINQATAIYLSEWLCCDENATQTISRFSTRGFLPKDEGKNLPGGKGTDSGLRSFYNRAAQKYRDMMLMHQQVLKESGSDCKTVDFLQRSQQTDSLLLKSSKAGLRYPFLDLCFIKWIAEDKFPFYDLMVYKKGLLKKDNEPRNDAIRTSYAEYFEAINNLKECMDDKVYTISALMLQHIESTFGHMSAANLAKFFKYCPELDAGEHLVNAEYFWKRLSYIPFCEKAGCPATDYPYCCWSFHGMVNYFSNSDAKMQLYADAHLLLMRGLLTEMLLYANTCMHPSRRRSWTKDDYSYAAAFFKHLHPIIERHVSRELGNPKEWTDDECNFIRYFYEQMFPSGLKELRCGAQRMQKERNARYNGKRQST